LGRPLNDEHANRGGIFDIMIPFPAEYMLKDRPEERLSNSVDPVGIILQEVDLRGIDNGMPSGHFASTGRAVRPQG
jgi:hypothetical protein